MEKTGIKCSPAFLDYVFCIPENSLTLEREREKERERERV